MTRHGPPARPRPRPLPRRPGRGPRPGLWLLVALVFGCGWMGVRSAEPVARPAAPDSRPAESLRVEAAEPAGNPFGVCPVNLLLVGTDADPVAGRTDTMIVLTADLERQVLGAVNIPRDTRVDLPGHGLHKVNAAYPLGGLQLAAQAVATLVQEPIHHFLRVDLAGFEALVDAIGGVDIDVPKRLKYTDRAQGLRIDLQPGPQRLNGHQAMQFVRFRKDAEGDLGRIRRQQQFLRAVAGRLADPRQVRHLPKVAGLLLQNVETTLSPRQVAALLQLVKTVDLNQVAALQLPGEPRTIGGASYWLPAPEAYSALADVRRAAPAAADLRPVVTVYNGSDRLGLERVVVKILTDAGYEAAPAAGATVAQQTETRIYAADQASLPAATTVAAALVSRASSNLAPPAFPPAAPATDGIARVVVVLGADYRGR